MLSTVAIAVISFAITRSTDTKALHTLLAALEACGIWLLAFAAYHLIRTPWLLDRDFRKQIADENRNFSQMVREKDEEYASIVAMKDGELAVRMREKEYEIAAKNTEIAHLTEALPPLPDVGLGWDWTEEGKKVPESWRGEKSIIVHNRSDQHIYSSRLDPIPLRSPLTFDVINEIAPKSKHPAVGRWSAGSESRSTTIDGYNQYIMANSEGLDEKGWRKGKSHNRGIGGTFIEIPMAVSFESLNATWKIEFDWHYDPADDESYFKWKRGYKA